MVKLALWMPLLSLAAFAVTSPVQSSPDGRDLRSQDSHAESTLDKKKDIKFAAFLGIEYVSGVTIEFIDRLPQDFTDLAYAVLKEIGFADKEDGIDDINRASETVDLGFRDLSPPDSRAESGPNKKAFIKRKAKELFDLVNKFCDITIDSFSEELTDAVYNILPRFQRLLSMSLSNSIHANEMVDPGINKCDKCPEGHYRPTECEKQAPPIEIFDSAMEIMKHIVASNFGINLSDLTRTLREAIPEGIMEKPIADPDDTDDTDDSNNIREDDIAATEAHSSSSADECAPGHPCSGAAEIWDHVEWSCGAASTSTPTSIRPTPTPRQQTHLCFENPQKTNKTRETKLQWFVDLVTNPPNPFAERLIRPPSPNQNKDASHTYVHMHRARDADLFEDFCKDRLPDDEVYVPPQHQPINPEDEDDVVPDQHAAFGITKATQRQKEAAWKDLGLSGLMNRGPPIVKGKGAAGGSRMPR
ncbi:protein kinase [Colletotrichum kahawae]|uniref:Protein kinase n=2 Tax=Colletotrichum gloeosporioides species complex TaxID=2707338 RepID=A0AAD9Y2X4_COLKA|nr:protein kinase [Colletotrichum kahawae]